MTQVVNASETRVEQNENFWISPQECIRKLTFLWENPGKYIYLLLKCLNYLFNNVLFIFILIQSYQFGVIFC